MKCLLLLALIALFFKAYAVEADIKLLAGVLSASSRFKSWRKGVRERGSSVL